MAWTEKDIPDLSGRTAVVTGANGGLGFQTSGTWRACGPPRTPSWPVIPSSTCWWTTPA
ncbi:hypothetical protein [Blastococcus sp. URHD0036]|uniref:hypothetical protein n=1 Tax=Blastococcus sp. URHD0036 TaxID=1380356 RepID=UPI001E56ED9F|nr:hypothetical protein [Blastococcus sp. URHD0036]